MHGGKHYYQSCIDFRKGFTNQDDTFSRGKVVLLPPGFLDSGGGLCDLVGELSVLLGVRLLFLGGLLSGELP